MTLDELATEVRNLKQMDEIRDITYQYWYAIDTKDPKLLKDVFASGEIFINFQDMPIWRSRDEFVAFFQELGLDPARQENHFGSSPRIRIEGEDHASGNWRLNMFAYNFQTRTVIRVTGEYDLEYIRVDGRWKICSSIFKRHSLFAESVGEGGLVTVPNFDGASQEAAAHLFGDDA